MSWFEVLKFIAEVFGQIPKYTSVNWRKKRSTLAEKLVKISSLMSAEIYLFS